MANIFVDFDGVLVRSRFSDRTFLWQKDLERELRIPATVTSALFQQPEWDDILSGKTDFQRKLRETFENNGMSLSAENFIEYWLSRDLNWRHEVLEFASELKSEGHSIYIATNQDRLRVIYIKEQREVQRIFEDVFASCDLGVCKPSAAFFRKIQDQNFSGQNELFIMVDDGERNIEAANSIGWRGLIFNPDLEESHSMKFLKASMSRALRLP